MAAVAARRPLRAVAWLLPAALALSLLAYLAFSVPGSWFPSVSPKTWSARDLQLVRGEGSLIGNEWVITALDANGVAIVSVNTDVRSADYAAIAWSVAGFPESAEAQLLWRNEYQPTKLHAVRLDSAYGRLLPKVVAKDSNWTGKIGGIALSIRGPLSQPVRIRGIVAKPMGALELLQDRVGEWLTFEAWSGTSINALAGGADLQEVPLPALLSVAIGVAALVWFALARRRGYASALPAALALLFVSSWMLLDLRWTANLGRQVLATGALYAGKDWRDRHFAAEDGPLFAFVEKARALLPRQPARVFVVADADYFRGRAAYHLYPHNVFFDPVRNAMPPASALRAGDYLVAYHRRGVQFNAAEKKLRWDGSEPVSADAVLVEPGAALFRIL